MDESAENGSEHGNNGGTGTTTIVLTPIGSAPSLSAPTTGAPPHGAEFSHHNQRVHPLLDAARTITKAPSTTTTTIKRPVFQFFVSIYVLKCLKAKFYKKK